MRIPAMLVLGAALLLPRGSLAAVTATTGTDVCGQFYAMCVGTEIWLGITSWRDDCLEQYVACEAKRMISM